MSEQNSGVEIESIREPIERLRTMLGTVIVGQERVIDELLIAFFSGGHCLIEGTPGLAKTLLARTFARALELRFGRIQFTPDLMPSDIVGVNIFNPQTQQFEMHQGPIFVDVLLADEINRTPPKTQAALLEAMEERQVTIEGRLMELPGRFFVMATQNPIEYEGTYPLPEAQIDRFLMKILIDYPSAENEQEMLRRYMRPASQQAAMAALDPVLTGEAAAAIRESIGRLTVEPSLLDYVIRLVRATREHRMVALGASPRAGLALFYAARTAAALEGRDFVMPEDVQRVAPPVLRHRLILKPETQLEGMSTDRVIETILSAVDVPR